MPAAASRSPARLFGALLHATTRTSALFDNLSYRYAKQCEARVCSQHNSFNCDLMNEVQLPFLLAAYHCTLSCWQPAVPELAAKARAHRMPG